MVKNKQIVKKLEMWNDYHIIKVNGTNKKRLIFNNEEVFKIFGDCKGEVLDPWNNYTYTILSGLFDDLIYHLKIEDDLNDFEVETESLIYNSDLLAWVSSNLNNIYYCDEALKEYGLTDFIKILQYAYIDFANEIKNIALNIIKDWAIMGIDNISTNFNKVKANE